ncbi:hypothetical protein HY573_02150, partial [Candidatus Parcubacteria bacterium]|nr:hypothetical protein [Candidatus Parcubacteria bacterium]
MCGFFCAVLKAGAHRYRGHGWNNGTGEAMSLGELVARGIGENENRADDSTGVVGYHPARDRYVLIKEMGAPKQVLTETAIRSLQECTAASAHVRWTTFGDQNKDNAHPLGDGDLWIVHNGEIRT